MKIHELNINTEDVWLDSIEIKTKNDPSSYLSNLSYIEKIDYHFNTEDCCKNYIVSIRIFWIDFDNVQYSILLNICDEEFTKYYNKLVFSEETLKNINTIIIAAQKKASELENELLKIINKKYVNTEETHKYLIYLSNSLSKKVFAQ